MDYSRKQFDMIKRALITALLCAPLALLSGQDKIPVGLPAHYKAWLDEEVAYIITPKEHDVFLKLRTERERDIFVEAFWKQRDPTPGTPKNEFRDEHYRRIGYANNMFGRSTPVPGWKTDRGRIYIILGEPKGIERYDSVQNVNPTEIWFYLGDPAQGMPTGFNVIFFKDHGIGDYIIYSPTEHGPRSLLAAPMSTSEDERAAYAELRKLEPNLARQSLSLIPGERNSPGSLSLASNALVSNIYALPRKMVRDTYADALLKYKDIVEVEYTANYIDSDGLAWVVRDPSGFFEVHYAVEPKKITVEDSGDRLEARFEVVGRVSDPAGKTVFQFEKIFPFSFNRDDVQGRYGKAVSLQDMFPLVPGRFTLDVLLKNTASREFSSVTVHLEIPTDDPAPALGPILLAHGKEKAGASIEKTPFAAGGFQILTSTNRSFSAGDTLEAVFQVFGLSDALRAAGRLRITFFLADKELGSAEKSFKEVLAGGLFIESKPLEGFAPGYYRVRITLIGPDGKEMGAREGSFEVSPLASIPRPMVVAKVMKAFGRQDYLYITGAQFVALGALTDAATRLAEAHSLKPDREDITAAYGQCLYLLRDYARARELLKPLASRGRAGASVLSVAGKACQALNEFAEAAGFYREYLERFGASAEIMNLLGTCWFELGNRDEALKIWEKSLEISPDQPKIKELLESLKKK
jgi:GWxTD domain-containing protein